MSRLRDALAGSALAPSCAYELAAADRSKESETDFDLYRLLNVWRVDRGAARVARMKEDEPRGASARPRALFIGTSFMWMLAELMRPHVEAPIAFYYNTSVYDVSEAFRLIEPVDSASPRWAGYALERDLYVLDINETYAHGHQILDFVETLDRRLP